MKIIVDGSGRVLQYSEHGAPSAPEGCSLLDLSDEQAQALRAATTERNSGLTFSAGQVGTIPPVPEPVPQASLDDVIATLKEMHPGFEAALAQKVEAKAVDAGLAISEKKTR